MKGCAMLTQDYDFSAFAPIREEKHDDVDASSVPLWNEVELGRLDGFRHAYGELVARSIYITKYAKKLLPLIQFSAVRKTTKLAVVSGKELGLDESRPYRFSEFREKAEVCGFIPPSAESILVARIVCNLEEGETLVALSDPIPIDIDNREDLSLVLVLRRWNGEQFLGTEDHESRLHPESKFIVEIPEA